VTDTRFFTCNLCEAMCGLRVTVDGARVTGVRGDDEDVLSRGHVCPKAQGLREVYEDPDRVRRPRIRVDGSFRDATWDEAMDLVETRLGDIRRRHGKDAIALYVGNPSAHSHRATLAAAVLASAFDTKNRFDANSQDSNPRLFACLQVYGDALTIPVPDVDRTDYLLMLGANPAASNGSMMALGDPKARFSAIRARGGKVVLVDPRRTESAAWCTSHHFIRPGGDAALLLALLHVIFEDDLVSPDAARTCSGLGRLRAVCKELSPRRVAPAIGIDESTIRGIARELATTKRAAVYARVGVCQNEFGPVGSWLVEALNLVTGHFDREGGMMFAKPAADIAPLARRLVGNQWNRWRSRVRGLPEFLGALPSAVMAEEMETPGDGQIRALVVAAGNPVSSTPNGPRLERAIEKLDFVVGVDLYENETTRHAHVLLPPKHVFEVGSYDLLLSRFTVRNTARYSPPIVASGDDTRDDWSIACELAVRLRGPKSATVRRAALRAMRDVPEHAIDAMLRTGPRRITLRELARAEHGIDYGPLEHDPSERRFRTKDRRANVAPDPLVADVPRVAAWVDANAAKRGSLVLIGRRHLRSNNSWLHNVRSLAKGPDRSRLMVHPEDAARLGLEEGCTARVKSRSGEATVLVTITDDVMPGVVSLPHGFGQKAAASTLRVAGALPGVSANALTDDQRVEPIIGTSILNGVDVVIERESGL
jgi:anaerobic selenocysteine-containing dehydrogenase